MPAGLIVLLSCDFVGAARMIQVHSLTVLMHCIQLP